MENFRRTSLKTQCLKKKSNTGDLSSLSLYLYTYMYVLCMCVLLPWLQALVLRAGVAEKEQEQRQGGRQAKGRETLAPVCPVAQMLSECYSPRCSS